jgi:hypothetical protein
MLKYSYEDILEMMGGYKYHSKEQLMFIFHKVNGNDEEANLYLPAIQEENQKVINAFNKLQTEKQVKENSQDNT